MNPLSALNFAKPMIQPDVLARAGQGVGPGGIPPSELQKLGGLADTNRAGQVQPGTFSNVLGQMVQDVSAKQAASADAVSGLLTGQNVSLHQAMIAMEEASVSFQLMVEVRNKLLESYQELMRMQI